MKLKLPLIVSLCLLAMAVFAQTGIATNQGVRLDNTFTNAVPAPTPARVTHFFQAVKPAEFLLIPTVIVLIMLIKKWIPKIPGAAWPYLAPFIGALLDYAATNFGLWSGNAGVGAMFGGLAVWFHQLGTQTRDAVKGGGS